MAGTQVVAGLRPPTQPKYGSERERILATRVGLHFPELLPYKEWEAAGQQIARIVDSSAWCLGDWVAYGQSRYKDRYQRAIEAANLDYQTIRNYAWVARAFDLSRRRDDLSFQHHAEVASMSPDQQDHWLDKAAELKWSRNALRLEIRKARNPELQSAAGSVLFPRIVLDNARIEHWKTAADHENSSLEQWIIHCLDMASRAVTGKQAGLSAD